MVKVQTYWCDDCECEAFGSWHAFEGHAIKAIELRYRSWRARFEAIR